MTGKRNVSPELSAKFANMSFVCACLVVCIHSGGFLGPIVNVAVPFFFLVSGYMLARHMNEEEWYGSALRTRLKTVVIPYVCWCVIPALIMMPVSILADFQAHRAFGTSVSLISAPFRVLGLGLEWPLNTPLWYLRSLMILVLLSPVIKLMVERIGWLWGAILFAVECANSCGVLVCHEVRMLLPISGALWFSVGWLACVKRCDDMIGKRIQTGGGAVVVGALILGLVMMLFPRCWIAPFSIPVWMFIIWRVIPTRRFPNALLQSTFLIFVAHMMVLAVCQIALKRVQISMPLGSVVKWGVTLVILVVINSVLRKIMPKAMLILTGGRC